jgi:Beta-lactamase
VNTIILGRILEKVTNESYASLMRERLLKPLGLDRTKLDTDGLLEPPFSHLCTACLTDCNIRVQRCEEPLTSALPYR